LQGFADNAFTPLRSVPIQSVGGAQTLNALVEFDHRHRRQTAQLGHGDFAKICGIGVPNSGAIALQFLKSMYAPIPQHQFAATQFQAQCRIG
jgi:hypothetical protein